MRVKRLLNVLSGVIMAATAISFVPNYVCADEKETIVLYTNDIHCAIGGYSKLAAYSAQLEAEGNNVIIVDAGDAIQGEVIGGLTEGEAIVDLMNEVGYDYAVPGNHEYDYGMEKFLELSSPDMANYKYLSSNFVDLRTNSAVFNPYDIVDIDGEKIAFIGVTTPETFTKSTPVYFMDENGNYIYGFSSDAFYETIQGAIDSAKEEGAQRVIVVGHLGIDGTTQGWKSTDVIANTTGIDVFIDAHSHEVIEGSVYKDKEQKDVLLSSTGSKFTNFGCLTLNFDGTEETELIKPENVNVDSCNEAKAAYDKVQGKIDEYNSKLSYLFENVGTAEVELTLNDPDSGEWVIRTQETNMGNFVADAYREMTGADVSFANGGGIRASIEKGDVTRKSLMDINPWNNEMCVAKVTGQQILDALEMGVRMLPEECGGFLHTSGLTYEVCAYRESPVIIDENGSFVSVDDTKARRVVNAKINGELIEPEKQYTLAATLYLVKNGGDGYTMFKDAELVKNKELPTDADMLIKYVTEKLNGVITEEKYGDLKGEGRITIYQKESDVPKEIILELTESEDEKKENSNNDKADKTTSGKTDNTVKSVTVGKAPRTDDADSVIMWVGVIAVSGAVVTIGRTAVKRKKA